MVDVLREHKGMPSGCCEPLALPILSPSDKAVIMVIDSTDRDRLSVAKAELHKMVGGRRGVPLAKKRVVQTILSILSTITIDGP